MKSMTWKAYDSLKSEYEQKDKQSTETETYLQILRRHNPHTPTNKPSRRHPINLDASFKRPLDESRMLLARILSHCEDEAQLMRREGT
jgi:hypothetical protein